MAGFDQVPQRGGWLVGARAARWDGVVPIRFAERSLIRPSAADIAGVRERVTAARGPVDGFDVVVWAEVAAQPGEVPALVAPYRAAGATWWIETAKPEPERWEGVTQRVAAGVLGGANGA
jgi:hypothetical protein